jgi:GntP family gluconate:H+ symporter
VGGALVASGAADRVVNAALAACGQNRGGAAMAGSSFVLSIPVFFDTIFYLLFPLARSMFRRTRHSYVKYLLAIGAGGAVTHTMVPPTPGPLVMAEMLEVDIGLMILVGMVVSVPMTLVGLWYAGWIDRRLVLETPPTIDEVETPGGVAEAKLPIILPIFMIASDPVFGPIWMKNSPASFAQHGEWLKVVADKNVAMLASAFIAMALWIVTRWPKRSEVSAMVEEALTSAGMIILITAAGGAFGSALQKAGVGEAIQAAFPGDSAAGMGVLWLAFVIAMLIKSSQGSTTVAIQTTAAIMATLYTGMAGSGDALGFHPVYLCCAIGSGAMISSWMNDSGFWLFCRMGGLTGGEGMKTWAAMTALMGVMGMATTLLLVTLLPGVSTPPLVE